MANSRPLPYRASREAEQEGGEADFQDVGTLQYDTYFNDDESQAIVLERFRDSDALILHGQNMAPLMDGIMATATVSGELLGDPNEQLRAQLAGSPVGLFALYQSLKRTTAQEHSGDSP